LQPLMRGIVAGSQEGKGIGGVLQESREVLRSEFQQHF
jgi:hypothetical protein